MIAVRTFGGSQFGRQRLSGKLLHHRMHVENLPDGGLMGILAQMGVALPHA
jgi:hypothetical protein